MTTLLQQLPWQTAVLGITLQQAAVALALFAALTALFALGRKALFFYSVRIAQKTASRYDDMIVAMLRSIRPSAYVIVAALIAVQTVPVPHGVHVALTVLFALVATHYIVSLVGVAAAHLVQSYGADEKTEETYNTRAAITLITSIVKLLLWVGSILFILANLGINITSLIAGLGIGGIAVALALQSIFKDLFSSFSIFFDKPFVIGDFIEVGTQSGTVQRIGVKTTRLRSLSGEEIIIPNQDLTAAHVRNFKRMHERRVTQHIGVTYETPRERLAQIPALIEAVVAAQPNVRFDRAHLKTMDDWALTFEVVYFITSRDYRTYMDARQAINLGVLETFAAHDIALAYPTQMVYHKEQR